MPRDMENNRRWWREWYIKNREKRNAQSHAYYEANREKMRELGRQWYEANRDAERVRRRQWDIDNRDRSNAAHLAWARKNPEKAAAMVADWARRNPDRRSHNQQKRSYRKRAASDISPCHTIEEWRAMLVLFAQSCAICGRNDVPMTRDHIVPLALGGTDSIDNIQPLCRSCNSRKGHRVILRGIHYLFAA